MTFGQRRYFTFSYFLKFILYMFFSWVLKYKIYLSSLKISSNNFNLNWKIINSWKVSWVEKNLSPLYFGELDLKGVNFWIFTKNFILLAELGYSHYFLIKYLIKNFLLWVRKKKIKKIIFFSTNRNKHFSLLNYFRFSLWKVGPYKLKGFHFFNEKILLKEGKKPFK